jgi:hypothetical protein
MAGFLVATIPTISAFIARQGVTKAVKRYGRAAVDKAIKAGAKVNRKVDDTLDKVQGVNKNTPGRKSKSDGITVGKKRTQADRRTQRIKGAAGGAAVTGAASMGSGKKTTSSKKLPLAKKGVTVDAKGTGKGMRYYQNGKEVRIK